MKVCEIEQQGEDVTLRLLVPELRIEMRERFSEGIHAALEKGKGLVIFDLTRIETRYSRFVGLIMEGVWRAKQLNRPVRIILKPDLYNHFVELGLQNAAELVSRE